MGMGDTFMCPAPGGWTLVIIGVNVVVFLLVMWLKPEWLKNF